jgi:hypothetical protein
VQRHPVYISAGIRSSFGLLNGEFIRAIKIHLSGGSNSKCWIV